VRVILHVDLAIVCVILQVNSITAEAPKQLATGEYRSVYLSLAKRSKCDWEELKAKKQGPMVSRLQMCCKVEDPFRMRYASYVSGFHSKAVFEVRIGSWRAYAAHAGDDWVVCTAGPHPTSKREYIPAAETALAVWRKHLEIVDGESSGSS